MNNLKYRYPGSTGTSCPRTALHVHVEQARSLPSQVGDSSPTRRASQINVACSRICGSKGNCLNSMISSKPSDGVDCHVIFLGQGRCKSRRWTRRRDRLGAAPRRVQNQHNSPSEFIARAHYRIGGQAVFVIERKLSTRVICASETVPSGREAPGHLAELGNTSLHRRGWRRRDSD
jgi:hypothetical protein